MIKNYIKTTLRSLFLNKAYSFLNIAGLATVSFQSIKAAMINPIKSLKTE